MEIVKFSREAVAEADAFRKGTEHFGGQEYVKVWPFSTRPRDR